MISNRAAAFAVITALFTGLLLSLALRPPGGGDAGPVAAKAGDMQVRLDWRIPVSFATTMPVLGDAPVWLRDFLQSATDGAVALRIYEPGELVPAFSISDASRREPKKQRRVFSPAAHPTRQCPSSPARFEPRARPRSSRS